MKFLVILREACRGALIGFCFGIMILGLLEMRVQMSEMIKEDKQRRDLTRDTNAVELNDYKQKVLKAEKKDTTWVALGEPCSFEDKGYEFEGAISRLETVHAMKENMRIVDWAYNDRSWYDAKDYVYGKGTDKVTTMMKGGEEEYKNLGDLMTLFDTIDKDPNASELEKITDMYTLFLLRLPKNKKTYNAEQIQMLFKYGGDCNDISAALYTILNYFDIETYIQWGKHCYDKPKKDGKQIGLHAWIKVRLKDGSYITLDPTWYQKEFVILPNRGKLMGHSLKDKHMRYK